MSEKKPSSHIKDYIRLRRCIMKRLYEIFQEYPYASIEMSQISEECQTHSKDLNWNMVYLEKCGYVELGKSIECPPYIASSATITAKGIDMVEDEIEFNKRFPDEDEEKPDVEV